MRNLRNGYRDICRSIIDTHGREAGSDIIAAVLAETDYQRDLDGIDLDLAESRGYYWSELTAATGLRAAL